MLEDNRRHYHALRKVTLSGNYGETKTLGIILNGVTGRMGTNQHLIRSILAIIKQGGIKVNDNLRLMPDPILTGRSAEKLKALAEVHGPPIIGKPLKYTTDLHSVLADRNYPIFFDASGTLQPRRLCPSWR